MKRGYFITGIDTNAGKTWATVALMHYFKARSQTVIGLKPVASGCERLNGKLVNDDALLLQQHASVPLDYDLVNPYAFELPVSPHIAAEANPVSLDMLMDNFNSVKNQAEIVLVEGAGGWYAPINERQYNSDLAKALKLPVLLTVPIQLGCINHAVLTYSAMLKEGVDCAGWMAVCSDPGALVADQILATLEAKLHMPLTAIFSYQAQPDFQELGRCVRNF